MKQSTETQKSFVVDDSFSTFAAISPRVKTATELCFEIQNGALTDQELICSAGIDAYRLETINSYCPDDDENQAFPIHCETRIANRRDVHKHESTNVLLGPVTRTKESFAASFVLSSRNELLVDHKTGIHVQGMVGVEACRQMALCICESIARDEELLDFSVSLDTFNLQFKNFVFPLPAVITGEVRSSTRNKNGWTKLQLDLGLSQAGAYAVTATMGCTLIPRKILDAIEEKRARRAIDVCLSECNSAS
ncbi:AfsA-related hotdog domain-containing protein [Corynebacterium suicordis]